MTLLALALGCYPGRLVDGGDRIPLRSAVHLELPDGIPGFGSSTPTLLTLLSDSQFTCTLEAEDPSEIAQQVAVQFASLYREGAHNLLLLAQRTTGEGWEGEYPVQAYGSPPGSGRWAEAVYIYVEEASVASSAEQPFDYTLVDYEERVPAEGLVTLSGSPEGGIAGRVELEAIDLSGAFESTQCGIDQDFVAAVLLSLLLATDGFIGE